MKFIERAYINLRSIDWKLIIWTSGFMVLFLLLIFPPESHYSLGKGIGFLFSFDFYEPTIKATADSGNLLGQVNSNSNLVSQTQNNLYQLLNITKVLVWLMTLGFIVFFLFKKPKTGVSQKLASNENEKQGVL